MIFKVDNQKNMILVETENNFTIMFKDRIYRSIQIKAANKINKIVKKLEYFLTIIAKRYFM